MEYLSVKETAKSLGLHEQTIYRKIARGEILCRRIGRTIRIDPSSITSPGTLRPKLQVFPSYLSELFWDIDLALLPPEYPIVIERILELGDIAAVRWLFTQYPLQAIRKYITSANQRRLSDKSLQYWQAILGIKNAPRNSHKHTKKTLGETAWR